ncbi:MAG: helicase-related protein, partial [Solirubrobacteraceae bacterium]
EEQVIVFAERVRCLRQLAATLRERHGVEAHVGDGSITTAEFEQLKARFTAGEFPVLCLSRIGHEGHNLQNASVLCHVDLPWLPSGLEQRVGRAARPGAARAHVQTYIPYIRGGGIEHVVSVLAQRGAEHHQILDSFEGVNATESTVASQIGQITGQVADSKDKAGYEATAARLRVAASVFGEWRQVGLSSGCQRVRRAARGCVSPSRRGRASDTRRRRRFSLECPTAGRAHISGKDSAGGASQSASSNRSSQPCPAASNDMGRAKPSR